MPRLRVALAVGCHTAKAQSLRSGTHTKHAHVFFDFMCVNSLWALTVHDFLSHENKKLSDLPVPPLRFELWVVIKPSHLLSRS